MNGPIDEFFDRLDGRDEPWLKRVTGAVRFDLTEGHRSQRWFLSIEDGRLTVSREDRQVDMVLRTHPDFFRRMAGGNARPVTAFLRNEIIVEGRPQYLILLDRLLPGPPGARDPRIAAPARGRS